jgi:hypothetical protein
MTPLYRDPWYTFRFDDDRIIPRIHLEGIEARRQVSVFKIDSQTGQRLGLLATAIVGDDGWVDLTEPIILRAGEAFIAVPGVMDEQITKLALVSHDYNVTDRQGRYDYSEHFARINRLCDEKGCDTILYALYTWDRESTVTRSDDSFFGGLNHVQRIVLEVGQPAIESYDHVEVWQRGHAAPSVAMQRFARAGASARCKAQFISDLPTRVLAASLLVLCGESGIISENRSGGFTDSFGFLGELDRLNVRVILNPIHDYMAKTHGVDMRDKRRHYSRPGRAVISVWNQGNGRDLNVPVPWTVYHDGEDRTADVVEVPKPFDDRPDIRIGILDLTRLTSKPTRPVS